MTEIDEELHDLDDMVEVLSEGEKQKLRNLAKVAKCSEEEAKNTLKRHNWDMSASMLDILTDTVAETLRWTQLICTVKLLNKNLKASKVL